MSEKQMDLVEFCSNTVIARNIRVVMKQARRNANVEACALSRWSSSSCSQCGGLLSENHTETASRWSIRRVSASRPRSLLFAFLELSLSLSSLRSAGCIAARHCRPLAGELFRPSRNSFAASRDVGAVQSCSSDAGRPIFLVGAAGQLPSCPRE